jgi:hypothetical protein
MENELWGRIRLCCALQARRRKFDAAFCVGRGMCQEGDCRFAWGIVVQNRWSEQHKDHGARVARVGLPWARLQRGARVMLIHTAIRLVNRRRMHRTHGPVAAVERIGAEAARHDGNGERHDSEDCGKPSHRAF